VFDRYTERARNVVVVAQETARSLNHNYIGSAHILLGILADDDCLATRALTSLGATYENTKPIVVKQVGIGTEPYSGQLPFTPGVKDVFEQAYKEALWLGHNFVGTEHILLALCRKQNRVTSILDVMSISLTDVDKKVRELLYGPERKVKQKVEAGKESELQEGWSVKVVNNDEEKVWTGWKNRPVCNFYGEMVEISRRENEPILVLRVSDNTSVLIFDNKELNNES
jgi:ATP-dependent Clp protease ATP-binding subunit ClpC